MKYIAIKVEGIKHWFWFETEKVTRENNMFVGKNGWGKEGALTDLKVNKNYIVAEIRSETLQYLQ